MKYAPTLVYVFLVLLSYNSNADCTLPFVPMKDSQKVLSSEDSSCLEKYEKKSCDMINEDRIAEIAGVDLAIITTTLHESSKRRPSSCVYKWSTGRKASAKTAAGTFEYDVEDLITIGSMKIYDEGIDYKQTFDETFDDQTAEEKAKMQEDMAERTKDEDELVQSIAQQLGKMLSDISYTPLTELGHGAYCKKTKTGEVWLYTLHKNLFYYITVNIDNDVEKNLSTAIQLSRDILDLCE